MKRTKIFQFLSFLVISAFVGFVGFGLVDAACEAGGSIAKFWPIAPAIKVAVEFLPKGVHIIPMSGTGSVYAVAIASVFSKVLEENVYPSNEFYLQSADDTPFVISQGGGQTVVTGVAGAKPNSEKNRSTLPATIAKRVDDKNDYDLDEFTTDPSLLTITEDMYVRYDKMQSLLQNHIDALRTDFAANAADIWLPSGADNIVRSSGTDTRAASAPSATGTRKRVTRDDIVSVATIMNRMDVPQADRNCVIPAEFLEDMLRIDGFVEAHKIGTPEHIKEGMIGRVLGFNVFMRSSVGVYDNTGTPVKKALGAAGAATDNLAALFWYKNWVNHAKGSAKVLLDAADRPEYYGKVMSAIGHFGGKKRLDQKGVVALVESA